MTDKPVVSVIIPSYNHASYIEKAIDSVKKQTFSDWELIIVDDGSSDDTAEVLESYRNDEKITVVINHENRGQSFVINQALSLSQGDFISFLPSDDWYLPGKLMSQVDKFRGSEKTVGVIYGRGYRYYEDTGDQRDHALPMRRGWILADLIRLGNFVYPITPLFKRECFEKVKFDESYRAEGEAIYLKIAQFFQFDYVEDHVGVMRDHSYNIGKNVSLMYVENLRYWNEFFDQSGLPDEVRSLRAVRIAKLKRLKGLELVVLRSSFAEGRRLLVEAIRLNPKLILDIRVLVAFFMSFLPAGLAKMLLNLIRR